MSLLTNLEAFFRLQTDSLDSTGNGHTGTDTLITYGADGATFGASSNIQISVINLQSGGPAWSAAVVVKPTNTTIRQQVLGNAGASPQLFGFSDQFGLLKTLYENTFEQIHGLTTLAVGVSVHLLFTYSAAGVWCWYVNGVLDSTGSSAFITATSFTDIGFSTNFGRHFVGAMQFLGLWKRELTGPEAATLAATPDLYPPAPPVITDIDPVFGPPAGGTEVNINGTGFVDGATVTFDGTPAAATEWDSDILMVVVTPAHAPGAVDVVVTNPDTQSGTLTDGFEYLENPPVVTSISPTTGAEEGGTEVILAGTDFQTGLTVLFGVYPATQVVRLSSTSVRCTTPAGIGTVTITVINPDLQSDTF